MKRRELLSWLTASPMLASLPLLAQDDLLYRTLESVTDLDPRLPRNLSALSGVFELEKLAEAVLPSAHFGYIYSAAGNGESKQANRDAYDKFDIQPRRLQGIESIDTSVEIFGERWNSPLFLCPTNGHKAFYPLGEVASAQGASAAGVTQILSSLSNTAVEQVNQVKSDKPVWFQLYPSNDEEIRYEVVRRAEDAGCQVIVVTVDDIGGRGSEIAAPFTNLDDRDCTLCHQRELGMQSFVERKPMFASYRNIPGFNISDENINFDDIRRLRDQVKGKLVVKGIMHPDDALGCLDAGADGILVSNHGGRIDSGGLGTLDALPRIANAVQGRMTLFLDGGVRRGTDVYKALAMGADAVGFGRPYLWGLAAFGAEGVTRCVQLLEAELHRTMVQAGVSSIEELTSETLLP
ncbi:MAG: alpha-hydroxy acid oxidase [Gammaproteobacteria bacterium]|nr:alpha-hydroxy acid oxidase [Gammaproteobacteria bacterium]